MDHIAAVLFDHISDVLSRTDAWDPDSSRLDNTLKDLLIASYLGILVGTVISSPAILLLGLIKALTLQ